MYWKLHFNFMSTLFMGLSISGILVFLSSTPFFMALMIILLTLNLGIALSFCLSKWLGMALILIFIGGMMVVFLYATSLSPNLKMKINLDPMLFLSTVFISLFFVSSFTFSSPKLLFYSSQAPALLFLVIYLLLTLFLVAKTTQTFKGALAQKFF